MNTKKSDFEFVTYWIKESSIKIANRNVNPNKLSISINPSGIKNEKEFVLTLDVSVNDKEGNIDIDLKVEATFNFKEELALDEVNDYFFINAPAIVFPYVRAYISTLSAQSGIPTIVIPTLNLVGLKNQLKDSLTESK